MSLKYRAIHTFSLPLATIEKLQALSRRTRVPQSRYVEEALEVLFPKYGASEILAEDKAARARPEGEVFEKEKPSDA